MNLNTIYTVYRVCLIIAYHTIYIVKNVYTVNTVYTIVSVVRF